LRQALLHGAVDLVVHSAKELPTAQVPGLQIAAFPARENPRDALVWPGGTSLGALPPGARIGTGSPRRAALLRATGRLHTVPVRGNIDTRLRKLADGQVDALVLAMAGLSRLGLLDAAVTPLDPALLMPAPAQGVLAVECRTDDPVTAAQLETLDHAPNPGSGDRRMRLPGRARRRVQRSGRRPGRGGPADRSRTGSAPVRRHRRPTPR
jgi:hydroxymethylbilane synthase